MLLCTVMMLLLTRIIPCKIVSECNENKKKKKSYGIMHSVSDNVILH